MTAAALVGWQSGLGICLGAVLGLLFGIWVLLLLLILAELRGRR